MMAVPLYALLLLNGIALLGLSIYGVHRYVMLWDLWRTRRCAKLPQPCPDFFPKITVQLPLYNELYVAERLLNAVAKLDYPREQLQIQVLDDSTDETTTICQNLVTKLAADGLNISYHHRQNRRGYKAGALEAGLASATGELIYILDADFVPPADALKKLVGFFYDKKIGMAQTRWVHLNRDASLLTRLQAILIDGHFVIEQRTRFQSGKFFNFNGTAGMWRKDCIIDAGGWQHDTITEDLDLSYRAQIRGWKFIFASEQDTPAELPADMNSFKSQQHRWTKGSVQTCIKLLARVWRAPIKLGQKIEASIHLTANSVYIFMLILALLSFPTRLLSQNMASGMEIFFINVVIFSLAFLSVLLFYIFAILFGKKNPSWRDFLDLPMLFGLGMGMSVNNCRAIFEAFFSKKPAEFVRTPKQGESELSPISSKNQFSYKLAKIFAPRAFAIEVVLALLLLLVNFYYLLNFDFLGLSFTFLMQIGFSYVAWSTLIASGIDLPILRRNLLFAKNALH